MSEEKTIEPASTSTDPEPKPTELVYDSNPFTSGWHNVQQLFKLNPHTTIGLAFFNVLIGILLVAIVMVFLFTIIGMMRQSGATTMLLPLMENDSFNNLSPAVLGIVLVLSILLFAATMTLLQVWQTKLALATAKGHTITFGAVLKGSFRYILPLFGFGLLVLAGILAFVVVMALLSPILQLATIVLALIGFIAMIYIFLRLSYVTYAIIDEQLGPIQSMKRSWTLTNGHLIETIGSAAVSSLVLAIPGVIVSALARMTEGTPGVSQAFDLLDLIISIVLVVVAAMPLAGRFVQIQAVANKQIEPAPLSPINYVAVLLLIVVGPILSALSPQQQGDMQNNPFGPNTNLQRGNDDTMPAPTDNSTDELPTRLQ